MERMRELKLAVACVGQTTSPHAARCENFMCYEVERGVIVGARNLPNMDSESLIVANKIIDLGFDVLLTGGIDMDMANALCQANIEVVANVSGTAREAVESYLSETLIGGTKLCEMAQEAPDPEDSDIESAFEEIAQRIEESCAAQ